uniref:Ferredoxin n=1 Tax=Ignisphaera aggregans TaxID=334771 RepID=A0A7J2U2N4_9CREN
MGNELEDIVHHVAKLMMVSAVTAPKARGVNNIVVKILSRREELELLAKKMEELSQIYGDFFARDAGSVRNSDAVVLLGCKVVKIGVKKPEKWSLDADSVLSLINLGIALGSATKTAALLNVDNRIMMSIGVAAQEIGLIDADYAFGIPLSARPKNIYFDRVWPPK